MIELLHHETRLEPAEYICTEPVNCAACGQEWDDSEEGREWAYGEDDQIYCIEAGGRNCLHAHKVAIYRKALCEAMQGVIAQAKKAIDEIQAAHLDVDFDEAFHNVEHPEDTISRWEDEVIRFVADQQPDVKVVAELLLSLIPESVKA